MAGSTAFFVSLALSALSTGVSILLNQPDGGSSRLDSGETALRPDQTLPWIFGRQPAPGIIFAQTEGKTSGSRAIFWTALCEGPICCIYDMRVNDVTAAELSLGHVDNDDSTVHTIRARHKFQYWNGNLDDNAVEREGLDEINVSSDIDSLEKPGSGDEEYPGTAYFGMMLYGAPASGGIPRFNIFMEGRLLPKIPDASGDILTFVSLHNKWITWKRTSDSTHFAGDILTAASVTPDADGTATLTQAELCVAIEEIMESESSDAFEVYASASGDNNYDDTEKIRIGSDAAFILTPRSGGHYMDSIFEDIGFFTHRDHGVWDFGDTSNDSNFWTAPFHYNIPFFLTGKRDWKPGDNPEHTLTEQAAPAGNGFAETYGYVADFVFDETFSDNPVRVKYFFENTVFGRDVDVTEFLAASKLQSAVVTGFYDTVPLAAKDMDILIPDIDGVPIANEAYHHNDIEFYPRDPVNPPDIVVMLNGLSKNAIGLAFDGLRNRFGVVLMHDLDDGYITIDMKIDREIIRVDIMQAFKYGVKVEYATVDGVTGPWTTFKDFTDGSQGYDTELGGDVLSETLETPVTARYIRFTDWVVDPDDESDMKDKSLSLMRLDKGVLPMWIVNEIRIFEGFPVRYARCDLKMPKSLTRREVHDMLNQAYAMFDYPLDGKMACGVYKGEDPDGFITDETIIDGTFQVEDIASEDIWNQTLISYFDVYDDFISHPLIVNDVEDQNELRRDFDGVNINTIIHGPRQRMDGHARQQQALRFVETSLLSQKIAPFKIEFEATRDAKALVEGKVYEIRRKAFDASGNVVYRLGSATVGLEGFQARLRRKVQYFDNRYLLTFEAHDNNVFQPNPRLFSPSPVQADRTHFYSVSKVENPKVNLSYDAVSVDPSNISFRVTWEAGINWYQVVGCQVEYQLHTDQVTDEDDDPWRNFGKSQGTLYASVKANDLRYNAADNADTETVDMFEGFEVRFKLTAFNVFGVHADSTETDWFAVTTDLFKPLPVSNLRLNNDIDGHPTWYIENTAEVRWNGTAPSGINTGPKNRNAIGTMNRNLKSTSFDHYRVQVQAEVDGDDIWTTFHEFPTESNAVDFSSVMNWSTWTNYLWNFVDPLSPLQQDTAPRKRLRFGVSQVMTFGTESDVRWLEAEHKGDFRKINLDSIVPIRFASGESYLVRDITVAANGDLLILYHHFIDGPASNDIEFLIVDVDQATTTKVVRSNNNVKNGYGAIFQTIDTDIHILWIELSGGPTNIYYSRYDSSYTQTVAPVALAAFDTPTALESLDATDLGDGSFCVGHTFSAASTLAADGSTLAYRFYDYSDPPTLINTVTFQANAANSASLIGLFFEIAVHGEIIHCVFDEIISGSTEHPLYHFGYNHLNAQFAFPLTVVKNQPGTAGSSLVYPTIEIDDDARMFIGYSLSDQKTFVLDERVIIDDSIIPLRVKRISDVGGTLTRIGALHYHEASSKIYFGGYDPDAVSITYRGLKLGTIVLNSDQD